MREGAPADRAGAPSRAARPAAHIALFTIASRDDQALRKSVSGLAWSTAIGVGLLVLVAFASGMLRIALWCLAIVLDTGGPYLFGAEGWKLVPEHFAERHGAIIIIALGESIVAIGAGASASVDAGVVGAAVLGVVVACALWWLYFDVVSIAAERRLIKASAGRECNEIARDSYSYLHFPMVAGIALVAVGLKQTLAHVSTPLGVVTASAMLGAAAMYLLAHVAFRWRNMHMLPRHRLIAALLLSAILLVELIAAPAALITLGLLALVLCVLILYEVRRFAELRARLRHQLAQESPAG